MYYIGIDVHKKKCVTTIKGDAKKVLKRTSFDNDITGINGFTGMLRSDGYLPATAVCESTGNYWIVLHDTLEAAGINTLLAHPYHLKIITQTAYKNDKADSEKLAELCRLDMIPESFVVNAAQRDMRELTRSRLGLVGDTVAPRNRIHAIVARYPYKRPRGGLFTGDGLEWLQSLSLSETDRLGVGHPPSQAGLPAWADRQVRKEDSRDRPGRPAGAAHHDHPRDRLHYGGNHTCRDRRPRAL